MPMLRRSCVDGCCVECPVNVCLRSRNGSRHVKKKQWSTRARARAVDTKLWVWCLLLVAASTFLHDPQLLMVVATEPIPQTADIVTVVNRNTQKDVRLDANLYIPDGGELLLPINVPRDRIRVDGGGPAKVTRVYSDHSDGSFAVGETIDIFIEFTSAVVVQGTPSLVLRTGCHSSECHVREVQRLRCMATKGKFAIAFDGQYVANIPYDASERQLATLLQRITKIDQVLVTYEQQEQRACTYFGNNITITFESVNIDGTDGDLPALTATRSNDNGDSVILGHVRYTPELTAAAYELQKGQLLPDRRAVYIAQAMANTLQFQYIVQVGDNTSALDYVGSDALAQSIVESAGRINIFNAGTLLAVDPRLPPPAFSGDWERGIGSSLSANNALKIDGTPPAVISITSPHVDGTFGIGELILIHVRFSYPVIVTGVPTIVLETGSVDRIINYQRVTGATSDTLEFQYVVQAMDTSPDLSCASTTALQLNGGTIKRLSTAPMTNALLTLPANGETGSLSVNKNIVIDTTNPAVTEVTAVTTDGLYTAGDTIVLQVTFDMPVVVTGTPQLRLSTGSVDLFPGYFVQVAPTGASLKTIVFPAVTHGLTTATSKGLQFLIDGQIMTVDAVDGDSVTMLEDFYGSITASTITIFSPGYRFANYVSGSGTSVLTFTYRVQVGDSSSDLEYVDTNSLQLSIAGSSIKRYSTTPFTVAALTLASPGTTGSLSSNAAIVINTDQPRILQSNMLTRDGIYKGGDEILFELVFDLAVVVDRIASVKMNVAAATERVALYHSGSGTTSLTFRFLCESGDSVGAFDILNTKSLIASYGSIFGTIRRKSASPLTPAVLGLPAAGLSSKGVAIDQGCGHITSTSVDHEDAIIGAGELVLIKLVYSVAVDVDITLGTPFLTLTTGNDASYHSGSGSTTLVFEYVVHLDDPSTRLNYADILSLHLNGAGVTETSTPAKIVSTILPPVATNALATTQRVRVDTSPPYVVDVATRVQDGVYSVGDRIVVVVTMNTPIEVGAPSATTSGTPALMLNLGAATTATEMARGSLAPLVSTEDSQLFFAFSIMAHHSTSNLAYVARNSLRCVNSYGVNHDGLQNSALTPHGAEFGGKLIVMWSEIASAGGGVAQLRAKSHVVPVSSGDDEPIGVWSAEDGGGVTGNIQFDVTMSATAPKLVALSSSKLYACWQEVSAATGNPTQIRVAVYVGGDTEVSQRWTFADKIPTTNVGLNRDAAQHAVSPDMAVHNGKLYAVWHETVASTVITQVRVAVYNAQDNAPVWVFVDGNTATRGINYGGASLSGKHVRAISCGTALYATWEEVNALGVWQIRVAAMTGNDALPVWTFVDGNSASGLNVDSTRAAQKPSIQCVGGASLVVAWQESIDIVSAGGTTTTTTQIRVKQLSMAITGTVSASAWVAIDGGAGGLNKDATQSAANVRLELATSAGNALYATWDESDPTSGKRQVRVARFVATSSSIGRPWVYVDGGDAAAVTVSHVNEDAAQDAAMPVLIKAFSTTSNAFHVVWQEMHAVTLSLHARIARFSMASEVWQSLHQSCIRRRSTNSITPARLLLPEVSTPGALDYGRQVRIDTSPPEISRVTFYSTSDSIVAASAVQTIDIFNIASVQQGQYRLVYDDVESECIDWNAPVTGAASLQSTIEGMPGLLLLVSVTLDGAAFHDGVRYTITFSSPTTGLHPLRAGRSATCLAWTCDPVQSRLPCNEPTLVQVNAASNGPFRGGIVDAVVTFSAPVVVQAGTATPTLMLETSAGGTDQAATYSGTSRGVSVVFDVGTETASPLLRGEFRLQYGDTTAAVPVMETTSCINAAVASHEDAIQELRAKLETIAALRTIGIREISRRRHRHGYRYELLFRSSIDLLDLVPADATTCMAFAGRTQTIDIQAASAIVQGEFQLVYGDYTSSCVSAIVRASGPSPSMEDTLANIVPDRVIPLQVQREPSIAALVPSAAWGSRYYASFMMQSDAMQPIHTVMSTDCVNFLCDDGAGGTMTCTNLQITTNRDFQSAAAASNTLAFRYAVQAADSTSELTVQSSVALLGDIRRSSINPTLSARLTLPSSATTSVSWSPTIVDFPTTAGIRVIALDEIPVITRVSSATRDDVYTAGDLIVIYVEFSLPVNVMGKPLLELNSKGVAVFYAGSGTNQLEFRYKILPGEASTILNYLSTVALRIPPNSFVSVRSTATTNSPIVVTLNADLHLPPLNDAMSLASQHTLVVNTDTPRVVSVTSTRPNSVTGDDGYGVGDILDIVVTFSHEVTVSGTPEILLNSGGTARFTYGGYRQVLDIGVQAAVPITSGQFAVSYMGTVSGCVDLLTVAPDSVSATSLKSRLLAMDAVREIGLLSVTRIAKKNGYRFEIVFDSSKVRTVPVSVVPVVPDVCAPLLPASADASPVRLVQRSTNTDVVFHYIVGEGDSTADLDQSTTTSIITDATTTIRRRSRTPVIAADLTLPAIGSPNSLAVLKDLRVDGSAVVIEDIVADSAGGTYGVAFPAIASPPSVFPGEILFHLIFSRAVQVLGTPTMELATGSIQANGVAVPNRFATFVGQPQPHQAAFLYHVDEGDYSANLEFASANVLSEAIVYCVSTSSSTLARTTLPRLLVSATSTLEVDSQSVPTTVKLSSSHEDGTFGAGEAIPIQLTFSKQVILQSGLNRNHDFHARHPVSIELQSNLYVFWTEWQDLHVSSGTTISYLYMKVFQTDPLNEISLSSHVKDAINLYPNTFIESVAVVIWRNALFAAWDEDGILQCAKFQGIDTPVGDAPWILTPNWGINRDLSMRASQQQLVVHNLALVGVWREEVLTTVVSGDGFGGTQTQQVMVGQIRVAQYNDADATAPMWIFHDGNSASAGINADPLHDARDPNVCIFQGGMYITWREYDPETDAYKIVVARRYILNRDLSSWQILESMRLGASTGNTALQVFISAYEPRLAVRRQGFEEVALLLTWYRGTRQGNASEVVLAEVFDAYWIEKSANILPSTAHTGLSAASSFKALQLAPCGDTIYATWIEERNVAVDSETGLAVTSSATGGSTTTQAQSLRMAMLPKGNALTTGWISLFEDSTAVLNHNTVFDADDVALTCTSTSQSDPSVGVVWTEFDGIASKLRFRHEKIPQRLPQDKAIPWGETSVGSPLLLLETGTVPPGHAFAIDRSGHRGYILTFLYVPTAHDTAPDLDAFDGNAFTLNGALVRDQWGQLPDFTVFPRMADSRSLSYNNQLVVDTSVPVVIDVTSSTPSGEYGVGERIEVLVTFTAPVTVTIKMDAALVGKGATVGPALYLRSDELHFTDFADNPAVYVDGSGSEQLLFVYVTTPLDYSRHLDYFRTDSLVLNIGCSIRRKSTFPMTDVSLALPAPGTAHSLAGSRVIVIKPTAPRVLDVTSSIEDGAYYPGDTIPIVVTFSLPVRVIGYATIQLATFSDRPAVAQLIAGNHTTTLTFAYRVAEGDTSSDLAVVDDRTGTDITHMDYVNALKLPDNSQILREATYPTTQAVVTLPAPGFPGSLSHNKNLRIVSTPPTIIDLRASTLDGTYDVGDELVFLVEFSHAVLVIGTPYIVLNIPAANPRTATYKSGSGSAVLTFTYTVRQGDNTGNTALDILDKRSFLLRPLLRGKEIAQAPAQVLCYAHNSTQQANLEMPRPGVVLIVNAVRSLVGNSRSIFIRTDGHRVSAMSADVASGQSYSPGQRIVLSVMFKDIVVVLGVPRLRLNAHPLLPVYAAYSGGSGTNTLLFEYVVVTGDSVAVLEAASVYALELPIGSAIVDRDEVYVPLRLGEPLQPGSLSYGYQIAVTSTPPSVISVRAISEDGIYGVGDTISIGVQFSRPVKLASTAPGALPSLLVALANGDKTATYTSGDTSDTLVFSFVIGIGDMCAGTIDYSSVNALVAPAPGILAMSTTPTLSVSIALPAPGSPASLSVLSKVQVSSTPPYILSVQAVDTDGSYAQGDRIRINVRFSFRVVVQAGTASSSCGLELFLGGGKSAVAEYAGGSTTATLVFDYRVREGDHTGRLNYKTTASLMCPVVQHSASPSLLADTTLPDPGATSSLALQSLIRIDAAAPRVLSVSSALPNGIYGAGQAVDILVVFTEPVTILDIERCGPRLSLQLAVSSSIRWRRPANALYTSGSGSSSLTFRYVSVEGDMALPVAYAGIDAMYFSTAVDGTTAGSTLECAITASGAAYRWASQRLPVPGATGSLSNTRDIRIDTSEPPRVVRVSSPDANGVFTEGDVVHIAVTFSAPVVIIGEPPFLNLDVGHVLPRRAAYVSGSGSSDLLFAYTIQSGDHSDRLEYTRCPDDARTRPRRRELQLLVICAPTANALQLGGAGSSIKRLASTPTTDAIIDLPEVGQWPKLRVPTSRQDYVYVDQLEDITDLTSEAKQSMPTKALVPEVSISQQRSSTLIYCNGIPDHSTAAFKPSEQRYFIELQRFPVESANPLSLTHETGFRGLFLNGIPFKTPSSAGASTDACGGSLDETNRYYYASLPTCFLEKVVKETGLSALNTFPGVMVGYAFDGFPIHYYKAPEAETTASEFTDDINLDDAELPLLDECHGTRGTDGIYRYFLPTASSLSGFMPCLRGIADSENTNDRSLLVVFRFPVDIAQVEGLPLASLTRFDGLVLDQNTDTQHGSAIWLNPAGVSVLYTTTTVIVRSNGIPDGEYGPFPNTHNPFRVQEQSYVFQFPRQPVEEPVTTPLPADSAVGVMLNGIPFFSSQSVVYAGDVMASDSAALPLLDHCNGLVDSGGDYRYYASPDCLLRELNNGEDPTAADRRASPLIGFALDGFPLYGPFIEDGVVPSDLDECNGRTGDDGTYRYHVRLGAVAPFLIGCFRGQPQRTGASEGEVMVDRSVFHSLSFAHALSIETSRPQIRQVFTNKHPGVYVAGETLDIVIEWSAPVVVDTSQGTPTLAIPNALEVATYEPSKSSPSQSVFVFTVVAEATDASTDATTADHPGELGGSEYTFDFRSSVELNGATIKRLAATPTLTADLRLVTAEVNSRFASKHQLITDVQVQLRGLYHPHASDLHVTLFHELRQALVVGGCCGAQSFGEPDKELRVNEAQLGAYPENPTSGVGWDYSFQDAVNAAHSNLARHAGATARQSSTSSLCVASHAIDGNVNARVSQRNVARTQSRGDVLPWWELRLLTAAEIGTIRIWLPLPERVPAVVQILRVEPPDGDTVVTGAFTLAFMRSDGGLHETTAIQFNAVAMIHDEDAKISNPGVGRGESIEAKIRAAMASSAYEPLLEVFVTRHPAVALDAVDGAFTWLITFLDDPQLPTTRAPLSVASNAICDGNGLVTLSSPLPGDDSDTWLYDSEDERRANMTRGHTEMVPFWVLLFEATTVMSFDDFDSARAAATWMQRVDQTARNRSHRVITVSPPRTGMPATQVVRIISEMPWAYLTLAEVEVFREPSHLMSQYSLGSPISPMYHPGGKSWSPEDSLKATFGGSSSEGTWTLVIQDAVQETRHPTRVRARLHGAGAISDWVLAVTTAAGRTRRYYMDIRAHVKTLPRHGQLYMNIQETETDALDNDGNGRLDRVEADTYLMRYWPRYVSLPSHTRQRVLWTFLDGYAQYGGIELLRDASGRQKLMPVLCDRACLEQVVHVDPYFEGGTRGDVALTTAMVVRDRVVRYVPQDEWRGLDVFTFTISIAGHESLVAGSVELHVLDCQDPDCVIDGTRLDQSRNPRERSAQA